MIFQDGGKQLYPPVLDRLVALLRPGGLLVTDNVFWDGEVVPGFVAPPQQKSDDTSAISSTTSGSPRTRTPDRNRAAARRRAISVKKLMTHRILAEGGTRGRRTTRAPRR